MTNKVFEEFKRVNEMQLPRVELFTDGIKWTTRVESHIWLKRGVDEELIAGRKIISTEWIVKDDKWSMKSINDVPVEECIE